MLQWMQVGLENIVRQAGFDVEFLKFTVCFMHFEFFVAKYCFQFLA